MDQVAKQHDIDYLISNGSNTGAMLDDIKAIVYSFPDISLQAFALRLGLSARMLGNIITLGRGFKYNTALPGLSEKQTKIVGYYLNNYDDHKMSDSNNGSYYNGMTYDQVMNIANPAGGLFS